jgi:hypothetical protein
MNGLFQQDIPGSAKHPMTKLSRSVWRNGTLYNTYEIRYDFPVGNCFVQVAECRMKYEA